MPRKNARTSGSSPEKPTPRRNTRRGRKTSEEPEEVVPQEIPPHLLRASDESTEDSDNDSDYGSPKKGRGRGKSTRGKKQKEPQQEEKPTPARRGRGRRAAAKEPTPEPLTEEPEPIQEVLKIVDDTSTDIVSVEESVAENSPEPVEYVDETSHEKGPTTIEIEQPSHPEPESVTHETTTPVDDQPGKVSEVTIEQDSNNDQAPVNEEDDASKSNDDVETGREIVNDVDVNVKETVSAQETIEIESESVEENMDTSPAPPSVEPEKVVQPDEEESKDPPESSGHQSDSNSTDKEVYRRRRRSRSSSGEIREASVEKMQIDAPVEVASEPSQKEPESTVVTKKDGTKRVSRFDKRPEADIQEVVEKKIEEEIAVPVEIEKTPLPEEKLPAPPTQRKRKWTARKNDDQHVIAITTDSLKNIISEEVKPVPLSDVKLLSSSPEPEPEEKRPRTKPTADDKDTKKKLLKERLRKQEEEENRRNEQLVKVIDKHQASANGTSNGTALLKDRKVSIVIDDPAAPPSPPKNESSNILYITNLVRPFTVLQLKGLLARTGKIVENGFWIDKIKSKCYVKYETEDEATETRHALHGVTWPSSNPKCLNVDFGAEVDMEKAIVSTLEEMPRIQITTENRDVKEEKDFGWSKDPHKNTVAEDRSRGSHSNRPVREWDVGKKEKDDYERENRDRERRKRSSERDNRRDKSKKDERGPEKRRSLSESPGRKAEKIETEAQPVRLLDDLFRKTKATPCIYWLPLAAEQIQQKEEQRQKNIAEHERHMEKLREDREQRNRRRSNSRDRRRRSVSRSDRRDRRYDRR